MIGILGRRRNIWVWGVIWFLIYVGKFEVTLEDIMKDCIVEEDHYYELDGAWHYIWKISLDIQDADTDTVLNVYFALNTTKSFVRQEFFGYGAEFDQFYLFTIVLIEKSDMKLRERLEKLFEQEKFCDIMDYFTENGCMFCPDFDEIVTEWVFSGDFTQRMTEFYTKIIDRKDKVQYLNTVLEHQDFNFSSELYDIIERENGTDKLEWAKNTENPGQRSTLLKFIIEHTEGEIQEELQRKLESE